LSQRLAQGYQRPVKCELRVIVTMNVFFDFKQINKFW
jgi:hypothetical protein